MPASSRAVRRPETNHYLPGVTHETPDAGEAVLEVTRRTGLFGRLRRGGFRLLVDGGEVARLRHDQTVRLTLPAGPHRLLARSGNGRTASDELKFDCAGGSTTRVSLLSQFDWKPAVGRSRTQPETALLLVVDDLT
jgi:hypothetical protein